MLQAHSLLWNYLRIGYEERCDEAIPSSHRLPPALDLVALKHEKNNDTSLLDGTDRMYLWHDRISVVVKSLRSAMPPNRQTLTFRKPALPAFLPYGAKSWSTIAARFLEVVDGSMLSKPGTDHSGSDCRGFSVVLH